MQYQNPTPREDVNYSKEHPLKEFAQLLIGVALVLAAVIAIINFGAGYFANKVPFSFERKMVDALQFDVAEQSPQQARLQVLADKLSAAMQLPSDITIELHYSPQKTVNALATLGGNVVIFAGLIEHLQSEQAIAMVVAHEIAHVKLRHPIVALGKGLTLATLAGSIGGASASGTAEWLIGSSANLSMLSFSRQQERAADLLAAQALYQVYGDIAGAKQLFAKFSELEKSQFDGSAGVELFRSHPYSDQRWNALAKLAAEHNWPSNAAAIPWHNNSD